VHARIVTSTRFAFAGDGFLLALHWADEEPPCLIGVAFGPPTTRLDASDPRRPKVAAVAAAVGELHRLLGEGKRPDWLAAMVEGDDCCFARLVRALASAEETGREAVGYGYACRRQVLAEG
jgi:hypothetical protein